MRSNISSTVLLTADLRAAKSFFVDVLGFEALLDIGWFASLQHAQSGARLDLWAHDHESVPAAHRKPSSNVIFAFAVDDLAAEEARFRQAGVRIVQAPEDHPWGQRNFVAEGPSGILIDVLTPIPPDPEFMRANSLG